MKKNCKVCKTEFECFDKTKRRKSGCGKRPFRSVTCSKKCSLIYKNNWKFYHKGVK